jgi:hypothetical protein
MRAAALEALGFCFFSQELQIFAPVYNSKGKSMIGYKFYAIFYTVEDQANNSRQCKTERCIEQER